LLNVYILLSIICVLSIKADTPDGWYIAKQAPGSYQPSARSVATFLTKNDTHAILYGGFLELVDYGGAYRKSDGQVWYNDIYLLDTSNPELLKWTKVEVNNPENAPVPRSFECVVYSPIDDSLYLYGGLKSEADYNISDVSYFSDSWVFDFSTLTWSLLDEVSTPGNVVGMACEYYDGDVIMTHGWRAKSYYVWYSDGISVKITAYPTQINETWRWDLETNTWTLLDTSEIRPSFGFKSAWGLIPNSEKFLLVGATAEGESLDQIWELDIPTLIWTEFEKSNVPQPMREDFAWAITSAKWFFMTGGDAEGTLTLEDTCNAEYHVCTFVTNPTDTNYFLRLRVDQHEADWEDESEFASTTAPTRRAAIVKSKPYLYLVGGLDWEGQNPIGETYNPYTWAIKLPNKYWN